MENHLSSRRKRAEWCGRPVETPLALSHVINQSLLHRERDEKCEEFSLREKKVTRTLSLLYTHFLAEKKYHRRRNNCEMISFLSRVLASGNFSSRGDTHISRSFEPAGKPVLCFSYKLKERIRPHNAHACAFFFFFAPLRAASFSWV